MTEGLRQSCWFSLTPWYCRNVRRAEPWSSASPRLGAPIGLVTRLLEQRLYPPRKSQDHSGASPYQRMSRSSSLPFPYVVQSAALTASIR
jgi:hypothetical protein